MGKKGSGIIRNITIFSGLSVAALHLFNRFESTRACMQNQERTREDKTYNWRSGNVDYKVKGYGDPILLIHDLNIGSNKAEFSFIFEKLSADHKVYCPDLPGFGKSDKPAMTYTASMYEDMISEFIRDVIKTETNIVVTGSSAPIIIKLAHNNPKLVKNLIMINPLGLYDQNLIPSIQSRLLKVFINIPIVGTFYAAPSPDKPPFVKIGDTVRKGDVIMIIESMKLMNEIQSDYDGVVDSILVSDGQTVEYDQPVMIIK